VSLTPSTPRPELVVVSNRLPVAYREDSTGAIIPVLSPGGLVAALAPALAGSGAAWVGWDGTFSGSEEQVELEGFSLQPVSLTHAHIRDHYEGLSNSTLWPLFHNVGVEPEYSEAWWAGYREVNQLFAQRVCDVVAEGGTVFVQDYQLMLVPEFVRSLRPDVVIGYFHHIPFPEATHVAGFEHAAELMEGLGACDVVGFQRQRDVDHFRACLKELNPSALRASVPHSAAYPISIDSAAVSAAASQPLVLAKAGEYAKSWGNPEWVFLGVDRLDYTKGIIQRLLAFEELLASGAVNADTAVFVQAGSPSRENVASYQQLSAEIDAIIQRVNTTFPSVTGRPAIVYLRENLPRTDMLALFVAADAMVVSSLADGMNLVAKEFVAARHDDTGVLILSTHAGAAEQMPEALLVDPFVVRDITTAMEKALVMDNEERARRMKQLRADVAIHDVAEWATTILGDLSQARKA
jgi:alpha,alpha-trehalose-phosphate synthase [UDP-forming]